MSQTSSLKEGLDHQKGTQVVIDRKERKALLSVTAQSSLSPKAQTW